VQVEAQSLTVIEELVKEYEEEVRLLVESA
jgi:hypothetical protein